MELCKTAHQCRVCIGLYTLSSSHGLCMGCCIVKGVSERCISRLLLTETMPTMIQTHLIMCKDWAETKDKAKSLEHIICKYDPPTPAMPLVTTGAGYWDYIPLSHTLLIKMKQKYPHLLRGKNQSKPEVELNLKENLKVSDKTHQKTQRQMSHILMITLIMIIIMIIILPQVKIEATDILLVKAVADNLEDSHSKAEARDLSIIHVNFRTTGFREAHIRVTAINTVATANPTSRVINQIPTEEEAMAVVLNKQEGAVMIGPITTIIIITSISIILMISRQNSKAPPCSLCSSFNHSPKHCYKGEHDINNIMEKMSINPHHQQQGTLYQ